jgi:AcrR family transcriptional regulator
MNHPEALVKGHEIPTDVKDPELVAQRRRQIVDAAVGLFIANGFHKTTTRQIAKAAGFSIGNLYQYVKTKEDVLYLVCQAIHQEMESRLSQRVRYAGNAAKALSEAMEKLFPGLRSNERPHPSHLSRDQKPDQGINALRAGP